MTRATVLLVGASLVMGAAACDLNNDTTSTEPNDTDTTTAPSDNSGSGDLLTDLRRAAVDGDLIDSIRTSGDYLTIQTLYRTHDTEYVQGGAMDICFAASHVGWDGGLEVLDANGRIIARKPTSGDRECKIGI